MEGEMVDTRRRTWNDRRMGRMARSWRMFGRHFAHTDANRNAHTNTNRNTDTYRNAYAYIDSEWLGL